MATVRLAGRQACQWKNVVIGGGGFVTGIIHNTSHKDLVFLRTDVGGAYRWVKGPGGSAGGHWQALLDGLLPRDWNLQGIESLATDPVEPQRLYIAAGTYTGPQMDNGALLWSDDTGETWGRSPLPFKMGGNEAGRGSGERLVVDPLMNKRLWMGTRQDGIWESLDYGRSWHRLKGFPLMPDGSEGQVSPPGTWNYLAQAVGVIRVVFDPFSDPGSGTATGTRSNTGSGCQVAYAALSRHREGLFVTRDGGASWQAVPGQPEGLRPTDLELASDSMLYVTFSKDPGPNTMGPGAVWRLDTKTGQWSNITPEPGSNGQSPHGHASIRVDQNNPARLVCSTWYRSPREELFLTSNRGETWIPLLEGARWDHSPAPWALHMGPHWICDASIDPFDPGRVIFTTGYGIWTCADIGPGESGGPTDWIFANEGIEETVPLALLSPRTGVDQPRLLSGIGDIDGFVHHNLDRSPAAGDRFDQPGYKNTECLADCPQNPLLMVRSGTTYTQDRIHGAWSSDGGLHWHAFASAPPAHPAQQGSSKPGSRNRPASAGPLCINADGTRMVWTPVHNRPWLTLNKGATWQPCEGLTGFMRVVPHSARADVFFAWDTSAGTLYRSDDGAHSFRVINRTLPVLKGRWGPPEGNLTMLASPFCRLMLAAHGTLWWSSDEGMHFKALEGVRVEHYGTGAPSPAEPQGFPALFIQGAIGKVQGLFRSDDQGITWIRIDDETQGFPTLRIITGDACIHGRVYIGTGGRGLFYGAPLGGITTTPP